MAKLGGEICGTINGEMHGKLNGKIRCANLGKIRSKIKCAIRGGRQDQFSGGTRGPWARLGPWHPQRTGNPGAAFDFGRPRAAELDGRLYKVWAGVFLSTATQTSGTKFYPFQTVSARDVVANIVPLIFH